MVRTKYLAFSFMAFFEPGQPIRFPDVTYSFYPVYAKLFDITYEEVPLNKDFTLPVDKFFHSEGGVILPNPNAPTSLYAELEHIEEIVKNNPNQVVIIDEAYIDFASKSATELIRKYDNVLVVQTTSKSRSLAARRTGARCRGRPVLGRVRRHPALLEQHPAARLQRPDPHLDRRLAALQRLGGLLAGEHRQEAQPGRQQVRVALRDVPQRRGEQAEERGLAVRGEPVAHPGRALAGVRGVDLREQAVPGQRAQHVVDRAGVGRGPVLHVPAQQLPPHQVAVRGLEDPDRAQHEQPGGAHGVRSATRTVGSWVTGKFTEPQMKQSAWDRSCSAAHFPAISGSATVTTGRSTTPVIRPPVPSSEACRWRCRSSRRRPRRCPPPRAGRTAGGTGRARRPAAPPDLHRSASPRKCGSDEPASGGLPSALDLAGPPVRPVGRRAGAGVAGPGQLGRVVVRAGHEAPPFRFQHALPILVRVSLACCFFGGRRRSDGRGALRSGVISKMWAILGMRVASRAMVALTSGCSSLGSDAGMTLSRTGANASASSTVTQRLARRPP